MGIGMEEADYVARKYGEEINERLAKIATILYDCEMDTDLTVEIAGYMADISAINFVAGVEFASLKLRETLSGGASSSNDE